MNSVLASLLADPKILALILGSFGTAIGWLIKADRSCRRDKAVLEVKLDAEIGRAAMAEAAMRERIATAEGTVDTLCKLLKRETNIG
jgi:hypothetical protein